MDDILKNLLMSGSSFTKEELIKIKKDLTIYFRESSSKEEILNYITTYFEEKVKELLYKEDRTISGISTSISVGQNYYVNIFGGSKNWHKEIDVDLETLFDIASITKLYAGLLVSKLSDLKLIDLSKQVRDVSKTFNLKDYSLDDIVNMRGLILTPKRLDECMDSKEAMDLLKDIYLSNQDRYKYNYTDMGLIVLTIILEEMFNTSYSDLLKKYILYPLNLKATYKPNYNFTGNGKMDPLPNDPKASILKFPIASAGLFTNSDDLVNLSHQMFFGNYLNKSVLERFCTRLSVRPKGIFGSYTKHEDGLKKTYIDNMYSNKTFAFEGYTGSIVLFDLENKIHNNILINAIFENSLKKHPQLNFQLAKFQHDMAIISMEALATEKYFKDEKQFVKKIKI